MAIDWFSWESISAAAEEFFSGLSDNELLLVGAVIGIVFFGLTCLIVRGIRNRRSGGHAGGHEGKSGKPKSNKGGGKNKGGR